MLLHDICIELGRSSRSSRRADSRRRRWRMMVAVSASHSRAADSTSVSSTVLQIEGRAADDLEHVGGGGLLLQRFAQFVEQPRVLDGDDGLRGEVLYQLDLLVGERTHLLAIDDDGADQLVVLEHRHDERRCARRRARRAHGRDRARCRPAQPDVGDVDDLLWSRRRGRGRLPGRGRSPARAVAAST